MSRKDYILLANAMASCKPPSPETNDVRQWIVCCKRLASALKSDNVRFDKEKFLLACGIEP